VEKEQEREQSLTLTIPEVATLLRISRGSCYEAIRRNELPYIKIGRRILVPRHGLLQMLSEPNALRGRYMVNKSTKTTKPERA